MASRIDPDDVREIEDFEAVGRELDETISALGIDGERITRELRKYLHGLPHELTDEEVETIENPEEALVELREEVSELFEG